MSHIRGWRSSVHEQLHRRPGPPRSTTTKPIAAQVQHTLVQMATLEMPPEAQRALMPKALGTDEMIRPPADRPTKNMKFVM